MYKVIRGLENHSATQEHSYKRQKFVTQREYLQIYNILSDMIAKRIAPHAKLNLMSTDNIKVF